MRLLTLFLFIAAAGLRGQNIVAAPQSDDELTPTAMAMVMAAQEEVLRLHFGKAKIMCAEAEALAPDHPFPLMMDVGCRLYEIEESLESGVEDKKAYHEFYSKDEALIRMAGERERVFPLSPY